MLTRLRYAARRLLRAARWPFLAALVVLWLMLSGCDLRPTEIQVDIGQAGQVDTGNGLMFVGQGACSSVDVPAIERAWQEMRSAPNVVEAGVSQIPPAGLLGLCQIDRSTAGGYDPGRRQIRYRPDASAVVTHVWAHEIGHFLCNEGRPVSVVTGRPVNCAMVYHCPGGTDMAGRPLPC